MFFSKKFFSAVIAATMSAQLISTYAIAQSANADSYVLDSNTITEEDISMLLENDIRDLIDYAITNPEAVDIDEEQLNNSYLGSPFSIANVTDNGVTREDSIKYIPVISNNEIISLITVLKDNNVFYCSLGKCFAPQLNDFLSTNKETAALVQENGGIFAVTEDSSVYTIAECFNENNIATVSLNADMSFYSQINDFNNIVSFNSLSENAYPSFQVITNFNSRMSISGEYYYNYLNDYPINQGAGMCWACVVASMVAFELPSYAYTLTACKVCDDMKIPYDRGGSADDIINALEYYLSSPYLPTQYDRALTIDEIITIIENVDSACMLYYGYQNGKKIGHATALYGFMINSRTNNIYLNIMEPHNGNKLTVSYPANSDFEITVDNVVFTWFESVRLLYTL